jgi:hypothetical protein
VFGSTTKPAKLESLLPSPTQSASKNVWGGQEVIYMNKQEIHKISYKNYAGKDTLLYKDIKQGLIIFKELVKNHPKVLLDPQNISKTFASKLNRSILSTLSGMSAEAGANNDSLSELTEKDVADINATLKEIKNNTCFIYRINKTSITNKPVTCILNTKVFKKIVNLYQEYFPIRLINLCNEADENQFLFGERVVDEIGEWFLHFDLRKRTH